MSDLPSQPVSSMEGAIASEGLTLGRSILNVPSIGRSVSTGRFVALSDEIVRLYKEVAADALNDFANEIAAESLIEVPREDDELANSIRFPGNDLDSRATPEDLDAEISYNTVYAAAQHEGIMLYTRHHPVIPARGGFFFEDTTRSEEVEILWVVEHHTIPGTKTHYLSDPLKAAVPRMEEFVGRRVKEVFGVGEISVP